MRALGLTLLPLLSGDGLTEEMQLPSGLVAERAEILLEEQPGGEVWLILRVIAPGLGARAQSDAETAAQTAADTDALCASWGVEAAGNAAVPPDQIVVQMMSAWVERGQPAPDITQVFAGYRFENGTCIWEDF